MIYVNVVLLLVIAYVFYRHHAQEKRIAGLVQSFVRSRAVAAYAATEARDAHKYHLFGMCEAFRHAENITRKTLDV